MSSNYAPQLPRDKADNSLQEYPAPIVAIQAQNGVPVASSIVTLSDRTTMLEVMAVGNPLLMKWGGATVSLTSFDHTIPPNTMRRFVVPQSVAGVPSIAGANVMNGLYNKVGFITATGSASVFTAEY